jgi:hypothetical protein
MGLFDDSTRKLGRPSVQHVKAEALAGPYGSYEGYDDETGARRRVARARLRLEAALDREALALGALGLAVGFALGAAVMWRRGQR